MLDFSYGKGSSRDQVKQFIDKWFNNSSSILAGVERSEESQLRAALDEPGKERIKDLARNPLRLSLLCFTWQSGRGKLPETKAELYQVFVEALYELKKGIFPTNAAQRRDLNAALGQLALKAIEQGYKSILPHTLVSETLEKLHPELYEEALKLGWLNRVGVDAQNPLKSVYAFYHPTFQEYFAACEIEDWRFFLNPVPHNIGQGNYRIFEPQWKEAFLLWLGRVEVPGEQKEEFITSLVEFKDGCGEWDAIYRANKGFYEFRAYFLAAAGVTEFRHYFKIEGIVWQIVKWGFGYFYIEKQQWLTFLDLIAEAARDVLPQTQRSKAISALVEFIGNCGDKWICSRAVESLGKIGTGNETAIRALVNLIGNCGDEWTRRRAVESLVKIGTGNETAIRGLVEFIGNCANENTRREAAESLGKIGTGNETAIRGLVEFMGNCANENTRKDAADSLGKIEPGNETAIRGLVEFIGNCANENTRRRAVESLVKIGTGNETAIRGLVELIGNCGDEETRYWAAYSLGKIGTDNETAIRGLVEFIGNCANEFIRWRAADSLGKIEPGNETAIRALVELIGNCANEWNRRRAAGSLGEIGIGNETAIRALVELIGNCGDENTRRRAVDSLGKIGTGNETAIRGLVELIGNCANENTRWEAAESLGKIEPGNETAIRALIELIGNCANEKTRYRAAKSLGKIEPGNETAIRGLVELIGNCGDENTRWEAVGSLGEIGTGNETAIRGLVKFIGNYGDENTRRRAVDSLGKIGTGNETAIRGLVEFIGNCGNCGNKNTRREAAKSLKKILVTKEQMAGVVYRLKDYLSNETYENEFDRFEECYKVIWHFAQTLPYPDFYRAWHRQPLTHPEMQDITAAGNTPDTQRLNLETLPQILATAANRKPDLRGKIKLICIDGSKFIDADNPAPEIYDLMLDLDCPERQNGEPATMQALKLYWNAIRRKSNQLPVWIFYEDPSAPEPQGFSEIFLNALSKFDGAICVVTDPPPPACLQGITLRWFDATEPDLIEKILLWIRAILLES
ncbi:MAG: HEAT repeat domain-containing protein [Microcoleus vaginatus WJT46-NPBG5]|nr:HEAT repeat domain-containing protein [Microcoleus vaginatus WJT46-NPBG5]